MSSRAWGARILRLIRRAAIFVCLVAILAAPLSFGLPAVVACVLLVVGAVPQIGDWAFSDGNGIVTAASRAVERRLLTTLESHFEGGP